MLNCRRLRIPRLPLSLLALMLLCGLAIAQARPRYWATYLGGNGDDSCQVMKIAANGDLLLAGRTASSNLKVSTKAWQSRLAGQTDVFVARLSGDGKRLLALTYLGGKHLDQPWFIHESKDGSIWVGGTTNSTDFPTTSNAYSKSHSRDDAFLVQFDAKLTRMIYGTAFGHNGNIRGEVFHVDEKNNLLYIGGVTNSKIPTTSGAVRSNLKSVDGYLVILDRSVATKTTLKYGTYLGGKGVENLMSSMSVDAKGLVTMTGTTLSTDLATSAGAFQTKRQGASAGFIVQVDPALSGSKGLVYSSYLGGSGLEESFTHIQDSQGRIHVLLASTSADLPTTKNRVLGPGKATSCYYAILDPGKTGSAALIYGTWIINGQGADGSNWGRPSLSFHPKGVAFYATTTSAWWTLPTAAQPFQRGTRGSLRGYIVLLDTKTKSAPFLAWSSEYGVLKFGTCYASAMAVHSSGDLYVTGQASPGLPVLVPVAQSAAASKADAYVARIEPRAWGSRFKSLGSACKGSAGIPKLTGLTASIGSRNGKAGALSVEASGMAKNKISAFILGSHKSWLTIPLPIKIGTTACTLQASPILMLPMSTANGKRTLSIPAPLDPRLMGKQVAVQVFILDPTANSTGLVLTNGLLAEMGW